MKRVKKKILPYLLVVCLIFCSLTSSAFAVGQPVSSNNIEKYTSMELGLTFERISEKDRTIVETRSLDGKLLHTAMEYNGEIYLDGKVISPSLETIITNDYNEFLMLTRGSNDINWGSWSTNTETIQTGGLTVAALSALLALSAGWCALGVIATIAATTAGKYDEINIKIKMRYGWDDEYEYYERITTFYGDGKFISVPGNPYKDSGKKAIK